MKIPVPPLGADATRKDDFEVFSAPSLVRFLSRGVQPPSQIYLKHTDVLQVQCASSQTGESVTFNYRLLRADGALIKGQFIIQVPNTRAVVPQSEPMAEGFLLSLSCKAAQATTRGQTFARAFLTAGSFGPNQPSYTLMADYVTTQFAPAHPGGRVLSPVEGPGWRRGIGNLSPPAGANWSAVVPNNARWRVDSVNAGFVTSAVVANRQPGVIINVGANTAFFGFAEINVPANTTARVSYTKLRNVPIAGATAPWVPLPPDLVILPGDAIQSQTPGLDAGDQYGVQLLDVEEWLDNV